MKSSYTEKILKILGQNRAVSLSDLETQILDENRETAHSIITTKKPDTKAKTAFKRSLKSLSDSGIINQHDSGQNTYALLTREGRRRAISLQISEQSAVLPHWDGYWRMVLLDLPESRKAERESLRYLLKKAGFICLKNSVWISPFPFEHMFSSIKSDMGLTTEMMIFTTNTLDPETTNEVMKFFQ